MTIYLDSIERKSDIEDDGQQYPFNLPIIKNFNALNFSTPVTFLVGENGSGKSTLLETIASGLNLTSISSTGSNDDFRFDGARKLVSKIKFVRRQRFKRSFFFRSEDFVGFADRVKNIRSEMEAMADEFDKNLSGYGRMLAMGAALGQSNSISQRYGGDLHKVSHGEGIFKIFQSRLLPNGLYLVDEPEASLSPHRQLAMLALMNDLVKKNCQFIIATHSPILMAYPNATIYDIDANPICHVRYDDCEHVSLTRDFLRAPEQFLKHLFEDDEQ